MSNAELHDEDITWARFSAVLETRFRFIETDQYHYQRLLEVKQGKDEDVLSFSAIVKLLAQKTLPSSGDPAVQNAYQLECDKRQLSAFIHGLRPNISAAVQLQAPKTTGRATDIANTVYLTFKSKNDHDDAHIYFTGRRGHTFRSMSCSRKSEGFAPNSRNGGPRGRSQSLQNRTPVTRPGPPWRAYADRGQYQAGMNSWALPYYDSDYPANRGRVPRQNFRPVYRGDGYRERENNGFMSPRRPAGAMNFRPTRSFGRRGVSYRQTSPRYQTQDPQMSSQNVQYLNQEFSQNPNRNIAGQGNM